MIHSSPSRSRFISTFGLACILTIFSSPQAHAATGAGSLDIGFDPQVTGVVVTATAVRPDGSIVVAGNFSAFGTISGPLQRSNIAIIDSFGNVLGGGGPIRENPNPRVEADGTVNGILVYPDGSMIIVGDFKNYAGLPRNGIARLNSDLTLDFSFDPGTGANGSIFAAAFDSSYNVLVGGLFSTFSGQPIKNLAYLNSTGSPFSVDSFDIGTGPDDFVNSIAVQSDGNIIIAGGFKNVNGQPRPKIARLSGGGTVESLSTFNPGKGPSDHVFTLAIQPDGKILVGGKFKTFNAVKTGGITRLNSDGSLDVNFLIGTGTSGEVTTIALQADGQILIGGLFASVNGNSSTNLARLSSDGSVENTQNFDSGTGANDYVFTLALQADGSILVGGTFTKFDGVNRNHFARLTNDPAIQTLTVPDFKNVVWQYGGSAPSVERVTFELSTDGGFTYSPLGNGVPVSGGFQVSGLALPSSGRVRVQGRTTGGYDNSASGLIEQTLDYTLPALLAMDLTTSNAIAFITIPVTITLAGYANAFSSLTYTLNFGDGTPAVNGTILDGVPQSFPHTYTTSGDFTVTGTVSDGTNTATQTLMISVPTPNSGGDGVPNVSQNTTPVTNPLNGIAVSVVNSNGGVVQLGINVDSLSRASYAITSDFGDISGRSDKVSGTTPVYKYVNRGIYVAKTVATNRDSGAFSGKARKMLTISTKETGEQLPNVNGGRALGDISPAITTKSLKGKFAFGGNKADLVTYSGMIKLPSGLDTSKTHEFAIGIGNIVANATIDTKGKGTPNDGSKVIKKLTVKFLKIKKGEISVGGEDCKVDVTFSIAGMAQNGFDTEGISGQAKDVTPGGSTPNRTIQVAMILNGVPYEAKIMTTFGLSKGSDLGTISGRVGQ